MHDVMSFPFQMLLCLHFTKYMPSLRQQYSYVDGDVAAASPSPISISPTLNLVHPCLCWIVFLYPFLLFVFTIFSNGLFVCSKIVNLHLTTHSGKASKVPSNPHGIVFRKTFPSAAGDRIEYSLDPTSNILVKSSVVPGGCNGFKVGRVSISRGWSR
jgi:hypothetical protein